MNNRPTPETDAFSVSFKSIDDPLCKKQWVPVEFTRKLERERDEARRKLNNLDVTAIHSCHNECQRPICVLRRERDEAREELHNIRLNLGADAEGYTLLHAVCVLQQERDDERAGREAYKQLAVKHALEREQARKEAHRFRALHYSHLGINASASWFPWEEKLGHE